MSEELKPCPFCGGEATCYHHDEEENGWVHQDWVSCKDEDCGAQTCLHATSHEAIAAWNRRDRPASGEREGEPRTDAMRRLLTEANARNGELRDALIDATAHLAAATSSYKRFCRKGVTGDALFSTKLSDYEKAEARARAVLRKEGK